jgi:RNA polymerase-interacting CarD/CdnL/TRCF family regulator
MPRECFEAHKADDVFYLVSKLQKQNNEIREGQVLVRAKFMGNLFAPEKPLKEVIRENQRLLKKSVRELEKEIKALESNEKKLVADIRKSAKANQMVRYSFVYFISFFAI